MRSKQLNASQLEQKELGQREFLIHCHKRIHNYFLFENFKQSGKTHALNNRVSNLEVSIALEVKNNVRCQTELNKPN